MPGVAITRAAAVQSWPELQKLAIRRPAATCGRVGVVEDDDRRLAAELEVHALEAVGRGARDPLAGRDAAGQRDQRDVAVA